MNEAPNRSGQHFGNYRLDRLLGRGGFAEVYVGTHLRLKRQAAIKILHTYLSDQDVLSFQREAEFIASLDHPNIVRILDFDVQQGFPFLVMDYLPQGTLRQRHKKGERVPLSTVLTYVKPIADALHYAHARRLIHRDVKPENMLIGAHNQIVLSDFGIAAIAHSTNSRTEQEAIGTVPYMAPEQIQAQARPASDQYALGIVIYELLAGERPFEGSFTEILARHLMAPPPPLCIKLPSLPSDVEQVILKALAKEPDERFSDIAAFATALHEAARANTGRETGGQKTIPSHNPPVPHALPPTPILKAPDIQTPATLNTPVVAPSASINIQDGYSAMASMSPREELSVAAAPQEKKPQPRKISRRNVIVGAGIGIVAAAGAGTTWWLLSPHPLVYRGHSWSVTAVAWSPDGKRIASGSGVDQGVHIWDATTGNHLFTYTGHSKTAYAGPFLKSIVWSPDSKRIASGDDKTVQVWDAADGGHPFVYQHEGAFPGSTWVAWSPDGKRIASAGQGGVRVWDAADGGHPFVYQSDDQETLGTELAVWSPDGKRIASGYPDGKVRVWDAVDGGHLVVYKGHTDITVAITWSPDGKRIASATYTRNSNRGVHIWDATTGNHLFTYTGHPASNLMTSVAWSPNGKRIASACATAEADSDKTVHVWDAADGAHLFVYKEHSAGVQTVAWSPDGTRIASGSNDKTVRVWDAQ